MSSSTRVRRSCRSWSVGAAGPVLRPVDVEFRLPGPAPEELDWKDRGLCAEIGINDDLWFPAKGGSVREALEVCAECPVIGECREYALSYEIDHPTFIFGIFGGLTTKQRRRIILERRQQAA
jgi:WhiB family redox-sensing transcriptional regulator